MAISTQDALEIGDNFYAKGDFKNAFDCYRNAALEGSGVAIAVKPSKSSK